MAGAVTSKISRYVDGIPLPVLVVIVACNVASITFILLMLISDQVSFGTASEVTLDGHHTGVYRLTVSTELNLPGMAVAPHVAASDFDGSRTYDQITAQSEGWTAACTALVHLELLPGGDAERCIGAERPDVGVPGRVVGASSGLAEALAAVTTHVDVLGDLRVAATGQLFGTSWENPHTGEYANVTTVSPIAGVEHKAAAASAAGVDVLVVPAANAEEFSVYVGPDGPELVAVPTVHAAIVELCRRSRTDACGAVAAFE